MALPHSTAPLARLAGTRSWFDHLLLAILGAMGLFILTPILALLFNAAPTSVLALIHDPQVLAAFAVTALSSFISLTLIVALGVPAAFALSRLQGKKRVVYETFLELPVIMPPVVAGLALLKAFGRKGILGALLTQLGLHIAFSLTAIIVAQVFLLAPAFIRRMSLHFDRIDPNLHAASALLGAGPFFSFCRLVLPLCRRPLLAESVMALAQSIGLFGAIILFAGNIQGKTQTLALAIYAAFQGSPERAFALSSLLLWLSLLLLLFLRFLHRLPSTPEPRPYG